MVGASCLLKMRATSTTSVPIRTPKLKNGLRGEVLTWEVVPYTLSFIIILPLSSPHVVIAVWLELRVDIVSMNTNCLRTSLEDNQHKCNDRTLTNILKTLHFVHFAI